MMMNKVNGVAGLYMTGRDDGRGDISFPCIHCGVCCTEYQVRLSLAEARRIADGLHIGWRQFFDRYVDQRWFGVESVLLRHHHGACIFLEYVGNSHTTCCLIHHFKPSACSDWSPSPYRPECQEGLHRYWALTVSPSGCLEGTEQNLRDFDAFLRSLVRSDCLGATCVV